MQDLQRTNFLIDRARTYCATSSDAAVAGKLGVGPKVLSNWRTGHKKPSLEARCDLAAIAGESVPKEALLCLVEETEGPRQKRFIEALEKQLDLEKDRNQVLRTRLAELKTPHVIASKTVDRLSRIDETRQTSEQRKRAAIKALIAELDPSVELQAGAAKMLQSMLNAFPPDHSLFIRGYQGSKDWQLLSTRRRRRRVQVTGNRGLCNIKPHCQCRQGHPGFFQPHQFQFVSI